MKVTKIPFSTLYAIGSFSIGTLLFIIYQSTKTEMLLVTGILYAIFALFFNLIILIYHINQFLFYPKKKKKSSKF